MTTTATETPVQQLTEHIDDWRTDDLLIDTAGRMVRHVALTGVNSRNGYRYTEQALRQAIPLYGNKPVFLDHAANVSRPYDRSTRDLAGSIVNPRYHDGRVRADIQLLDTEAGRTFLALAAANRPAVGMSHVVLAHRSSDKSVVEKIHDVVSVDAVVFPAATSTFREQTGRQPAAALPGSFETILAEIDACLPDHFRQLSATPSASVFRVGLFPDQLLFEVCLPETAETKQCAVGWSIEDGRVQLGDELTEITREQMEDGSWIAERQLLQNSMAETRDHESRLQTHLDAALSERDELRRQLDRIKLEQQTVAAKQEVDQLIEESQLPGYAVTDVLRQHLLDAPDQEARRTLIDERCSLLQRCTGQSPLSRERLDDNDSALGDKAIVAAIKQHRFSILAGVGSTNRR